MAAADLIEKDLEKQIIATHKRFQKAMQARLAYMSVPSKERYFAVLSLLVTKLEDAEWLRNGESRNILRLRRWSAAGKTFSQGNNWSRERNTPFIYLLPRLSLSI